MSVLFQVLTRRVFQVRVLGVALLNVRHLYVRLVVRKETQQIAGEFYRALNVWESVRNGV